MFQSTISVCKSVAVAACATTLLAACGSYSANTGSDAQVMNTRRGLSLAQWFSKQGLTAEEIKTVNAILNYVSIMGGPTGNAEDAARFAERKLDALGLDGLGLSDVGPILALKSLTHLTVTLNSFSQAQIEELLVGLPNLRTISVDGHIQCRPDLNPKVKCLK